MPEEVLPPSTIHEGCVKSALDCQNMFADNLMAVQRNQLRMLAAWQQSMSAINQDLWDRWVCRFGGGVPLDG
jgi:hypothetical protein